jgi:hypothetical protein
LEQTKEAKVFSFAHRGTAIALLLCPSSKALFILHARLLQDVIRREQLLATDQLLDLLCSDLMKGHHRQLRRSHRAGSGMIEGRTRGGKRDRATYDQLTQILHVRTQTLIDVLDHPAGLVRHPGLAIVVRIVDREIKRERNNILRS